MRRIAFLLTIIGFLLSVAAAPVAAGGPPSLSFYVDGERYRTIGTPTDFADTGAPDFSYDRIYALGDGLINVAEAKPGDRDFNGGRWLVYPVIWADGVTPVQYTNDADILAAAMAGDLTIGDPVKSFVCPVIAVPGRA